MKLHKHILSPITGGLFFSAWLCSAPVQAAAQEEAASESAEAGEDKADAEPDESDDDSKAKWYALVGGDVYTGTGEVLRGATLLLRNEKIHEIGYGIYIPENAQKLNIAGLRVYPGMVALSASSRITQGTLASEDPDMMLLDEYASLDQEAPPGTAPNAFDGLGSGDGLAPEQQSGQDEGGEFPDEAVEGEESEEEADERVKLDEYDPYSPFIVMTLGSGITAVEQGSMAVKLRRQSVEDVVLSSDHSLALSFGSADSRSRTREDFKRAAEYLREIRAWEAAGKTADKEPNKKGINTGVLRVLRGEIWAKFSASERDELLAIARLAQTYNFRPVIEGAREGWTVADELGRAGAIILLVPRDRRWNEELQVAEGGSSIENAARLHAAGCQVAVQALSGAVDLSGITGRDLMHLMVEAGFAVRGGLSAQAALEAVTIVPARILGCDHRIGSIEVGKDADFVVTDGDLLHYETFVQYAFVHGELAYDKRLEIYFAHIRPRPELPSLDEPVPEGATEEGATEEEGVEEAAKDEAESEDAKEGAKDESKDEKDQPEDEDEGEEEEPPKDEPKPEPKGDSKLPS